MGRSTRLNWAWVCWKVKGTWEIQRYLTNNKNALEKSSIIDIRNLTIIFELFNRGMSILLAPNKRRMLICLGHLRGCR